MARTCLAAFVDFAIRPIEIATQVRAFFVGHPAVRPPVRLAIIAPIVGLPVVTLRRLPLLIAALALPLLDLEVAPAAVVAPLGTGRLGPHHQQHKDRRYKKFHRPGSMRTHITPRYPPL